MTPEQKAEFDVALVELVAACVEEASEQFVTKEFADMGPLDRRIMLSATLLNVANIIKLHPVDFLQWLRDHKTEAKTQN